MEKFLFYSGVLFWAIIIGYALFCLFIFIIALAIPDDKDLLDENY